MLLVLVYIYIPLTGTAATSLVCADYMLDIVSDSCKINHAFSYYEKWKIKLRQLQLKG